jgi:hypothetical protein
MGYVDLNCVIVVAHTEHNGNGNVDIATLEQALDISPSKLLLRLLTSNGTQS